VELDLTDAAGTSSGTLETIDVVRRLVLLEVLGVPTLMDGLCNGPQVNKCLTVVGTLKDKVAIDEWGLVCKLVDEELNFVEDTNVVFLVLDLEVAVGCSAIFQVDHVLAIDELGELCLRGSTGPDTVVDLTLGHDFVGRGRVGGRH